MVGKKGFEPSTPPPPAVCATRLRYFPNYFFAVVAMSKGTIIIKVIKTPGLNNQYNKPIENMSIHISFFCKICIYFLINFYMDNSIINYDVEYILLNYLMGCLQIY